MTMKKNDKASENEKTSEQTASVSEAEFHYSLSGLLGDGELKKPTEAQALLRLSSGLATESLLEKLEITNFPSHRLASNANEDLRSPIVLGPFKLEELKSCAQAGLIGPKDGILVSFNRWKSPKLTFPGLSTGFGGLEDLTETSPMERTQSMTTDFTDLEVEALDDALKDTVLKPTEILSRLELKPSQRIDSNVDQTITLESPSTIEAQPSRVRVTIENTEMNKAQLSRTRKAPKLSFSVIGASLALVFLSFTVVSLFKKKIHSVDEGVVIQSPDPLDLKMRSWPENLRPRGVDSLYSEDDPRMRKLRPILIAYERGATVLSAADEQVLRTLADPASASWRARLLASNQLSVFYLAKLRLEDARRVLQPILEAAPNDPTTLLNDALLRLAEGDTSGAKESASVGIRLCPPELLWVAYSILGIIHGSAGRIEEAEKNFENALARSSNNPFIYGMWIQSLSRSDTAKRKISMLIREALWSDPERLIDSPIRAPLAGHILKAEALAGFKRVTDSTGLSAGQSAFLRWLDARDSMNPLGENTSKLAKLLASEANPQSQVLYAYLLKIEGNLDAASEILGRSIPLLEGQRISSSWAWSFAGDLQNARRQMDQALIYYQAALSRNPQDAAAVLGLAIALREAGDFQASEQKFAESLSLDPNLIPALLRIDRFEWHRRSRAQ